jgi:hypothetical protein
MTKHEVRHNPEDHDYDYTARRTIHIKLWTETHKNLKKVAAEVGLSMQEIINELAERVGNGDNRVMKILEEYKLNKRNKEEKSLRGKVDATDVYAAIAAGGDPLKND